MTVHDALDLVEFNPEFVEIEIKQTHLKGNSHNVISEIEGTDYKVDLIAEHEVSVNSYSTYIFIAVGIFLIIAVVAIILTSVLLRDEY